MRTCLFCQTQFDPHCKTQLYCNLHCQTKAKNERCKARYYAKSVAERDLMKPSPKKRGWKGALKAGSPELKKNMAKLQYWQSFLQRPIGG